MSEAWAIAIFTSLTGCLLVIAKCLWSISASMKKFVLSGDCDRKMCAHEKEIDKLRKTAIRNQRALSAIQPIILMKHGIDININPDVD